MRVDERWSPGASGVDDPAWKGGHYRAAYSARWIDQGDLMRADVVPDRQGFAYDDPKARDELIALLVGHDPAELVVSTDRDTTVQLIHDGDFHCFARRAGGYIYVDAWLTAERVRVRA